MSLSTAATRFVERAPLPDTLSRFGSGRACRPVHGADADLRRRRWRLFFLATAGLFGRPNGDEWGVSHHLLRPT